MKLFLKFSYVQNCNSCVLLPLAIAPLSPLQNRWSVRTPVTLLKDAVAGVFLWILQSLGNYFIDHLQTAAVL